MTTESRPVRDFWPTAAEEDACRIVTSVHNGDLSAGIYQTSDNWYYVTWSDGLANSWREKYTVLSLALARLATLAYCQESDWEFIMVDDEEAGFANKARPFLVTTVE